MLIGRALLSPSLALGLRALGALSACEHGTFPVLDESEGHLNFIESA